MRRSLCARLMGHVSNEPLEQWTDQTCVPGRVNRANRYAEEDTPGREVLRKPIVFAALGVVVVGVCVLAALITASNKPAPQADKPPTPNREDVRDAGLTIVYPLDGTLFPPEIAPPTLRWKDGNRRADSWIVSIDFGEGIDELSYSSVQTHWTPSKEEWETIKHHSLERLAKVTIHSVARDVPDEVLSSSSIQISTSKDEVGAPLFFREVNLPFADAVKDPAAHIRWRFGPISSPQPPPIILEKMPNCANCHSFSADGSTLAMDVDYANDKGSHVIAAVEEEIILDSTKIITWSDYLKEDNEETFGLLPQISPDGKHVICMVKDQSVFVAMPDLAFSQLFFPFQGILAYYRRETGTFHALPGADNRQFVHANPAWSPDGKQIVFARSKVRDMNDIRDVRSDKTAGFAVLTQAESKAFLKEVGTFQYDLYRIPFNDGEGGKAEHLEGASHNGMSNYFPKYSPDGKWIVFCKAKSFMLLQADSELHIIPAGGGEARRLRSNTGRMNSWHSWSPNGKWLVFSSKAHSIYTQLFLTHIDPQGRSTPPVVLENLTAKDRAANIPEFVNTRPDAIKSITPAFLDDIHYARSGGEFARQLDYENAIRMYRKALEINPRNTRVSAVLGDALVRLGRVDEAKVHFTRALELQPDDPFALEGLGTILAGQGRAEEAVKLFGQALQVDPELTSVHFRLGVLLLDLGRVDEARVRLTEAVRLDPADSRANYSLGIAFLREGNPDPAVRLLGLAIESEPDFLAAILPLVSIRATSADPALRDGREALELAQRACELTRHRDPTAMVALSEAYAEAGQFVDAISVAQRALKMAREAKNQNLVNAIQQRMEFYRRNEPLRQSFRR